MTNATNDPLVGTTYDSRYRIERRIGSGGMANVYLAEDTTLGRRVAIKVLHQRYAEDSQFVERFLREASAAARLSHPNIVQVYDRGQADGSYYIAMEFIDGMTLKDLVRRRGALTEPEVLAYGRQALHALRSAHRNGIVHRDVKPHNMMVDTDGRLKIADFGIARAAADADQGLTEAGSIVGTAQYLSPEQAQGHEVAASSDLYSLGVVMYEMSTGRVPFDGESPVNVALKHVKDPVPRPSRINPQISTALESIILKAMEKDPSRRYNTADEMLADLDRARDGSTTAAMTQVMAGAAAGAGLGAAGAHTSVGATRVTPITPAAASSRYDTPVVPPEPAWPDSDYDGGSERGRRKRSPWRWVLPLLVLIIAVGIAIAYLLNQAKGDPVPDVVGQTAAQATTELEQAGFDVATPVRSEFSDKPKFSVIDQTPDAGEKAKDGTDVELVVSKGPAPIEVPDVVGKSQQDAVAEITDAGLPAPKVTNAFDPDADEGSVIRQNPAPGTEVAKSRQITIVVSKGAQPLKMPDVRGESYDSAKSKLEGDDFGFVVTKAGDENSSEAAGTVVGQDPAQGTPLEAGAKVRLTVASGRNAVPDVAGQGQQDAVAEIQNQGFRTNVVFQPVDDLSQVGQVIGTDPDAGSVKDVGSTVTVTVGQGQDQGETQDDPTGDGGAADPGTGTGTGTDTTGGVGAEPGAAQRRRSTGALVERRRVRATR